MKKVLPSILALVALHCTYYAMANDTLLYRSDYERRLINNTLHHQEADFISLYSMIDTDYQTLLVRYTRTNAKKVTNNLRVNFICFWFCRPKTIIHWILLVDRHNIVREIFKMKEYEE